MRVWGLQGLAVQSFAEVCLRYTLGPWSTRAVSARVAVGVGCEFGSACLGCQWLRTAVALNESKLASQVGFQQATRKMHEIMTYIKSRG